MDEETKRAQIWEKRSDLHGVISRQDFEIIGIINKQTQDTFLDGWIDNLKRNKKLWRRQSKLRNLSGLGRNKAVVGIGSGKSFNKNKDVLKRYINSDGVLPWEQRNFITIAANDQFKPLLEMGIVPDFVIMVDGADSLNDQLNKDIPPIAKNTQLITGVHTSPKICRNWVKQGRGIIFYTNKAPGIISAQKEHLRGADSHSIELGGNVLNGAFNIGASVLQSTVFIAVGNDLSFEIHDDVEEQKKRYYADGDYSTNLQSKRDEGVSPKRWAGYTMEKRRIVNLYDSIGTKARYNFELDIVGTSWSLWTYKIWFECTMMAQTKLPAYYHYFNASEGGILGVMARKTDDDSLKDPENWYFLDEVCINEKTGRQMYMTAMLEDAFKVFLNAKRSQDSWEHYPDAQYASDLVHPS